MVTMYDRYNRFELRILPYILSKAESNIYKLIKYGESNKSGKLQALKYKRNILRKVLLNKLSEWDKELKIEPQKRKPELTYSDILEQEQSSKLKNKMEAYKMKNEEDDGYFEENDEEDLDDESEPMKDDEWDE